MLFLSRADLVMLLRFFQITEVCCPVNTKWSGGTIITDCDGMIVIHCEMNFLTPDGVILEMIEFNFSIPSSSPS